MSLGFVELAGLVDELENTLTQKAIALPAVLDLSTPLADQQVVVLRNRVITSLRAVFFLQSGHLNISLFMMFCNTFGFEYQNVDAGPVNAGFIMRVGALRISVR